jgi:hypothetical protein
MRARAVASGSSRRIGGYTIVWLVIGLTLLGAAVVALYSATRNDRLAAYHSAPPCASLESANGGADCRYIATGTVTFVAGDTGDTVTVYFDVPGSFSPFFGARLSRGGPVNVGDSVQIELWEGRVTKLGGESTDDNPENDPLPRLLVAIGALVMPLGLGALAWGFIRARRERRGGELTSEGDMSPLAMSDVLSR